MANYTQELIDHEDRKAKRRSEVMTQLVKAVCLLVAGAFIAIALLAITRWYMHCPTCGGDAYSCGCRLRPASTASGGIKP
jgi:hypothetical protein